MTRIASILTVFILVLAGCLQQKFSGIAPYPYPAPDFTLTNQHGEQISLRDLRGKIIVMSFLYTNCPTVCPLITSKFTAAAEMLGDAQGVVFIAVSVDPEGDTMDRVREFLKNKGLQGRMHYLIGEREELEEVWSNYNIYVNKSNPDEEGNYLVDHTAIVYVIDREGNLRVLYPGLKWNPKFLVRDIRMLQREESLLYRLIYDVPRGESPP